MLAQEFEREAMIYGEPRNNLLMDVYRASWHYQLVESIAELRLVRQPAPGFARRREVS